MARSTIQSRPRAIAERNRLVEENLDLVREIAVRLHSRVPPSFLLDDLIGAGNLALVRAADRWDDQRRVPFRCYAQILVHGAIVESARRKNYQWAQVFGEADLPEVFLTRDPAIEIDSVRMRQRLYAAIDKLSPRQREIIELYYGDAELRLKAIASRMDVCESRVSQIKRQGVESLRDGLQAA